MSEIDDLPRIPGYRVEAVLGSGGMATVYRGRQLALDRPVAIKILRAYGRDAEELNRRFEQEAKLIAALDHPCIVAIFEVLRTEAGDACYVMPLLAHGDLASRPRPLPETEVKRILTAVLEALGHAHGKGVVHRDVKPENVLFDARGTPLLADFGVALKMQGGERLTAHGRAVGSSHTMSPEQARGEVVDGRSDLYSVGCLAVDMLTGAPPFAGDDFLAVALKHQQDPVPRLPPALAHWQPFIDRALAKRPDDRYPDAGAMISALEAIERRAAPARRLPLRALAIAAAAVLALVALLGLLSRDQPSAGTDATTSAATRGADFEAALAAGQWFEERPDSAAALLLPRYAVEPVEASAIDQRDRLLDRATARYREAPLSELEMELPRWRAFVDATHASATPAVRELVQALAQRLQPELDRAHAARDRGLAGPALALAQLLPDPDAGFAARVGELARFPASGEPFRDGEGPALLLIPGGRLAGFPSPFAITVSEITRADYERYARASGRDPARCRDGGKAYSWRDPGFAQGGDEPVVCVSYGDAVSYAQWLSQQTGRAYRLPTLAEWNALQSAARVDTCANLKGESPACQDRYRATAPAGRFAASAGMPVDLAGNVREWTQSCEWKEIGAVRRLFSNLGRMLQGKERDASGRVCVGRYVAGSGWRDSALDRAPSSEDEDQASVDRGFRLVREIR